MVKGIDIFKKYFKDFSDQYVVIGGTACDLLMEEAGVDFRATKDFDVVLIIEALKEPFVKAFWQFINDGGYTIRQKSNGKPQFYRFCKPSSQEYPAMIELFSKMPDSLLNNTSNNLIPLHISEEVSSLSAILVDESYYNFLLNGRVFIGELPILDAVHLIPFKAKAWLDLSLRKNNGEQIDTKNITKHKNDIFRLFTLLSRDLRIALSDTILNDMKEFIEQMQIEKIDLEIMGLGKQSKDEILAILEQIYILNK